MPSWFSRVHREYEAGNLTLNYREVLLILGRFHACRFGIFPSHQTLATRARCSVRTVQRALQAARELGRQSRLAQPTGQQSLCPDGAGGAGPRATSHYRTAWPRSDLPERKKPERKKRHRGNTAGRRSGAPGRPGGARCGQTAQNAGAGTGLTGGDMVDKPMTADAEALARAVNAQPWEPLPGMVKR